MEELLLTSLGIYLLNRWGKKSPMNVGNIEPLDETGNLIDRRDIEDYEQKACPWFWYTWKRPAVFDKVPLSPGSRQRWLDLCELWLEIRKIGAEIKFLEAPLIDGTVKKRFVQDIKDKIKDKKNIQAFLLSETKRIANVQMRSEDLYKKVLKENFDQETINEFYAERKKQIQDRVWPNQDTTIVPNVEKKNNFNRTALAPDAGRETITAMAQQTALNFETANMRLINKALKQVPASKAQLQTIKQRNNLIKDHKRSALAPGKRISADGNVYYEYRQNRTDQPGKTI